MVLLHDVLQSKVDLLLELLNLPGLHQPGPIWAGERMFPHEFQHHHTGVVFLYQRSGTGYFLFAYGVRVH